jgi:hypothetical protein
MGHGLAISFLTEMNGYVQGVLAEKTAYYGSLMGILARC